MLYSNRAVKEIDKEDGVMNSVPLQSNHYKVIDSKRVQEAFLEGGIALTLNECRLVYEVYSEARWCAGWESGLDAMSKEVIFNILLPYLIDIINDRGDRLTQLSEQLIEGGYVTPV